MFCEILDIFFGKIHQFLAVYAKNTQEQRKALWSFVTQKFQEVQYPLIMGGDFNVVLSVEDREQGNLVTQADIMEFAQCVEENELVEVRAVSDHFTWTNNHEGNHRIWSNLNRCFANAL